ncbi:MAG: M3 family oligoendopeptidase, partial [Clostridia bacterium]|nr:M3 family oligoendopeptidase [Clostridia bacterium]
MENTNWIFADLPYTRYDVDDFMRDESALLDALEQAQTADEAKAAYLAIDALSQRFSTTVTIAHVRHDCDTNDKFYDEEMTYWDTNLPRMMPLDERLMKTLLAHPFRKALEDAFGKIIL